MYLIDEEVGSGPNLRESGGDYERQDHGRLGTVIFFLFLFFSALGRNLPLGGIAL